MIGSPFQVIIPFQPEVGIPPLKAGNPQNWERKQPKGSMLRTSHSAKTCEASAQASVKL